MGIRSSKPKPKPEPLPPLGSIKPLSPSLPPLSSPLLSPSLPPLSSSPPPSPNARIVALRSYLQELKEKHSKNFTNLRIDISIYDDGDCEMVLFGEREETPGEVKNRLSQEEQSLKLQREMELRQLEILKKKYE